MISTLRCLLVIIENFGLIQPIATSTTSLSDLLCISQQSVSRILIDLEKKDFITRTSNANGISIKFKPKSIRMLKSTYDILDKYFGNFSLIGRIKQGIGEGKYYVTLPKYRKLFRDKLNISQPFLGTLNVHVDANKIEFYKTIFQPIAINGFKTKTRSFGSIVCYKCVVNDRIPAWVLFAERTTHPDDIVEILSEHKIIGNDNSIKITFI